MLHTAENKIRTGISYMYEDAFSKAILPLLSNGDIDALEWSFDTAKDHRQLPGWTQQLLKEFSAADRLYGHGVYYSLFSGKWHEHQSQWIRQLSAVLAEYPFRHISEHFGFMTSGNAHEGAPLPVPFVPATLQLGIHRLKQLKQIAQIPVGVENLAFAFSPSAVQQHGAFLGQLVAPVNGFILLDLHNIYCQAANFGVDAMTLIAGYPLHRVKEIHVSGGSWETSAYSRQPVRRDTHDDAIPEEVFRLLQETIPLCPFLDVVIVERLGHSLKNETDEQLFREDFLRVRQIVTACGPVQTGLWPHTAGPGATDFTAAAEDPVLYQQQSRILKILKQHKDAASAYRALQESDQIDQQLWDTGNWQLPMIETAMLLGKKWGISVNEP